ncbi:MAG: molybdate ABC transporter substrate-binding protein [Candidatus Korobacteraceae bacterium]
MNRLLLIIIASALAASAGTLPQANHVTPAQGIDLSIAAPDDLNSALTELARHFEQKTGNHIRLTFADSATLLTQVRNNTAFDAVFLDMQDLHHLAASGLVTASSITEYARDTMVLCFAPGVRIDPRPGNPLLLLTDKSIPRIAIVSPEHSAFGTATVQALTAVHIYDVTIRRKLVIGDSVAEVAQLLQKGGADVAVLPGSALNTYQLRSTQIIPIVSAHFSQLRKGAGVLKKSQHQQQALAFLKFAVSPQGQSVFHNAGLE